MGRTEINPSCPSTITPTREFLNADSFLANCPSALLDELALHSSYFLLLVSEGRKVAILAAISCADSGNH